MSRKEKLDEALKEARAIAASTRKKAYVLSRGADLWAASREQAALDMDDLSVIIMKTIEPGEVLAALTSVEVA